MARSSDPKKLALWQSRFQRFLTSDLTVARFCVIEHVSESSFYYWQNKLGPRAWRRPARAEGRDACSEDGNVFQPVTVVPTVCGVLVRLAGGTQIEVDVHHLDAIRAVVAETVRIDRSWAVCSPSVERNVSSHSPVTRNRSSDSQVIRKRGTISKRNGAMRKRGGAASC